MEHIIYKNEALTFSLRIIGMAYFGNSHARDVIWWTVQVEQSASAKAFPND